MPQKRHPPSLRDGLKPFLAVLLACGCAHPGGGPAQASSRAEREDARMLAPAPESVPRKATILGKDPDGCTWIESEALVMVGEQETRLQARAAAVDEARKNAMQDFLGVDVRSRFLDFQQEGLKDQQNLVESMLQTTRLGRIMKEQMLAQGYQDLPDCAACRYFVKLKSCLLPMPEGSDRDFQAELELSRTRFVEGDEAKLTVTANKDGFVYLYDVGMDWETSLLAPNDLIPEIKVKAGESWEYPGELARKGVRLVAQLPEGKSISAETIRVIVTKTPLPRRLGDPASGGYLGVLRRMNASRLEWTDDAQAFTIYKR